MAPDLVALGHRAMNRPVVKTAPTKDAVGAGIAVGAAIPRNLRNVWCEGILTPLPNVAGHVVQAELIRRLLRDRMRVAIPAAIPSDGVDVVAAAEAKSVAPVGAASGGILPLGLRRQAKGHVGCRQLGRHRRTHRARVDAVQKPVRLGDLVPRNVLQRERRPAIHGRVGVGAVHARPQGLRDGHRRDEKILQCHFAPVRAFAERVRAAPRALDVDQLKSVVGPIRGPFVPELFHIASLANSAAPACGSLPASPQPSAAERFALSRGRRVTAVSLQNISAGRRLQRDVRQDSVRWGPYLNSIYEMDDACCQS